MTLEDKTHSQSSRLISYLPILSWLPKYDRSWLRFDIIAGLTLWGLAVPEAMAYAGIAGLPPQAGLYTLVAALLIYALFGSSRHLVVQSTSATAALLASAVVTALVAMAAPTSSDPETYQAYASAFVLVTGLVFLAAGLARLGFITQFLSKPVMSGFVVGLAIFVMVGQLNKLFGVPKPEGNTLEKLLGLIKELPQANWVTFVVGALALMLLFLLPRWNKKIPAGLVVLFGAIGLSMVLDLSGKYGVHVVGTLPKGLPSLAIPQVPFSAYPKMVFAAIGVLLVAFSESLGVAHEFAEKHGYEIDADQELNAHAAANLASALFGGLIAGGSMSTTAVKEGAGARTQMANSGYLDSDNLDPALSDPFVRPAARSRAGALIIHALWHIVAARKLLKIQRVSRVEVWFGVLTLAGVLLLDVQDGMVIGLVASLLFVVYKTSRPYIASLGRLPSMPGAYSDLNRNPESIPVPGVLIVRVAAQVYYANALTVRDRVKTMMAEMGSAPRAVIFDAGSQEAIDVTSMDIIKGLVKELNGNGIEVYLANEYLPVLEHGRKTGLVEVIGEDHVFPTIDTAVHFIETSGDLMNPIH